MKWISCPPRTASGHPRGCSCFANDPLLFEPETQYGYSTFGWILVSAAVEAAADEPFFTFMRTQIFKPLGMTDTTIRLRDRARSRIGRPSTTGIQWRPSFRARAGDHGRLLLFRGRRRDPVHAVRPGALRDGGHQRQAAAACHREPSSRHHRCWLRARKPTTASAGCSRPFSSRGAPTRLAGHASRTMLGGSTSFLTFPERGIVVAVTTNIAGKDTRSIALGIAQAFAEQRAP